jgi:hypothetical protein
MGEPARNGGLPKELLPDYTQYAGTRAAGSVDADDARAGQYLRDVFVLNQTGAISAWSALTRRAPTA